jgi:hypothetical protein
LNLDRSLKGVFIIAWVSVDLCPGKCISRRALCKNCYSSQYLKKYKIFCKQVFAIILLIEAMKMRPRTLNTRWFVCILAGMLAVQLVGCSSSSATLSASSELTTVSKLALGILKLENTSTAVTADQAKQLLTLWQAYQSLANNDTTSQVELDALVSQIEGSLTDAQLKAIDAMGLTDQSINETLSTWGAGVSSNSPSGTPAASALSQSSASSALPSAGSSGASSSGSSGMPSGTPGGAPPSGSGGMVPGGDSSGVSDILNGSSLQSSADATQSPAATGSAQVNPMLLQAVIRLMETRSQSAG